MSDSTVKQQFDHAKTDGTLQKLQRLEFVPKKDGLKFEIESGVFVEALGMVIKAMPSRVIRPVDSHVLIAAQDDGSLWLRAGGPELQMRAQVTDVKIERNGAVTLPGKFLHEVVMSIGKGTISFDSNDDVAKVVLRDSKQSERTLSGMQAGEYGVWPRVEDAAYLEVDSGFVDAVKRAITTTGQGGNNSVYVKRQGADLVIVSTDGYHLSYNKFTPDMDELPNIDALIRASMLSSFASMCDSVTPVDDVIKVEFTQNTFHAWVQGERSITRSDLYCVLTAGKFVKYEHVIPTSFKVQYRLDRDEVQQALRTMRIYSRSDQGRSVLLIRPSGITLYANEHETGHALLDIDTEFASGKHPGNMDIQLSTKLLIAGVNNMPKGNILLGINSAERPIVVKPDSEDSQFCHLLMPMKPMAVPKEITLYNTLPVEASEEEPEGKPDLKVDENLVTPDEMGNERVGPPENMPELSDDVIPF